MDTFKEEELKEKRYLYQGIHTKLKQWYQKVDQKIRDKYGDIPPFWQDLESWTSTKQIVKLFLTMEEKLQEGNDVDVVELEARLFPCSDTSNDSGSTAQQDQSQNQTKKKRNRWGDAPNNLDEPKTNQGDEAREETTVGASVSESSEKKPRKSRWAPATNTSLPINPGSIVITQEIAQQTIILNMKLQHLTEKVLTVAIDAARIEQDPNRSPSPPPKYDSNGKRTNTREIRMREELMQERIKVIEELIRINPSYIPPPDYVRQKPFKKLYIPIQEYPTYNFIGLLIGPRGNTQRQMELETGCKISIRGKGSVKDGRIKAKQMPDEDDELHVHIQGETEANVAKAAAMVMKILTPVDDENNEHKQKQLRELALINGTFREDEYCPICGEKGHRQYECTNRTQSFKPANVKCSICGDLSHPTRDCPFKEADASKTEVSLDQEYSSFMAELDGKSKPSTTSSAESKVTEIETVANGSKQTIIHASTIPASAHSQPAAIGQTTIVMPAYVDGQTYAMPGLVWNGMQYVQAANVSNPAAAYPSYPSMYPGQVPGMYYPPAQDYYAAYIAAGMWPQASSVPSPPSAPPLPQMPPPPSNPKL